MVLDGPPIFFLDYSETNEATVTETDRARVLWSSQLLARPTLIDLVRRQALTDYSVDLRHAFGQLAEEALGYNLGMPARF